MTKQKDVADAPVEPIVIRRDSRGDALTDIDPYNNPEWRQLKHGEHIQLGDLFRRTLGSGPYTVIEKHTVTRTGLLNGLMWMTCYPLVFRRVG